MTASPARKPSAFANANIKLMSGRGLTGIRSRAEAVACETDIYTRMWGLRTVRQGRVFQWLKGRWNVQDIRQLPGPVDDNVHRHQLSGRGGLEMSWIAQILVQVQERKTTSSLVQEVCWDVELRGLRTPARESGWFNSSVSFAIRHQLQSNDRYRPPSFDTGS